MPTRKPNEPPPKPDDPAEYQRFVDMAREVEADESPEAMELAFRSVLRAPVKQQKSTEKDIKVTRKSEQDD